MIYIFTEDSRDGKELIESVVKILYPDYDIKVDTLQGIYNAVNKLKEKGVVFHDIDIAKLQTLYKEQAKKEGFTFDPKWQNAVDKAIQEAEKENKDEVNNTL